MSKEISQPPGVAEITPLPAATVVLVRDAPAGLEVLLLQRNLQSKFMPGMFLFPGGALDPEDTAPALLARIRGITDEEASAALGIAGGAIAYFAAAIRECFEEAGVLLACDATRTCVRLQDDAVRGRYGAHREALNAGTRSFVDVLREEDLHLAIDSLTYFSHWITPVGAPRRYDTRFFVTRAPAEQDALHDNRETIHHMWMSPRGALEGHRRGELKMRTPTVTTLQDFARYDSADALIGAMRERRDIPAILPRITERGERVMPGDPRYERIQPQEGHGQWK
jgi:8-oxo-dGTP pyrophosphatase MutT (NUDIX family)